MKYLSPRIISSVIIFVISLGLMGLGQIPQNYTVRVGIYENPPKIYTDASGSPSGFWSEIIKYIARKEGWQVIWVTGTWEEGLRRLENNEIDLMPDVAWSAARAEKFIISNEAILTSWARVYVLNENNIQTILDLDGKKVGGLQGSLNFDGPEGIKDLANRFGAKVNFISYQSYDDVFKAIQNQQVDAGITNKDFGDKNEKKYSLNRTPIIIQPAQLRFALSKKGEISSYLAKTLDRDIAQLKAESGSAYYQLLDKYLGEKPLEVTPRWVATAIPVAGGIIVFLLVVSLISRNTVRRQTKELRASEERYRALLENYPDILLRIHRSGKILDLHVNNRDTYKTIPQDITGKNVRDMFSSELAEFTAANIEQTLANHEMVVKEFHLPVQGEDREYEVRYSPGEGEDVIAIIRDITARKKAEKELKESEERYQSLARVSPVGIFRTDINGLTTYVNPTWSRISGLSFEEALGNKWLQAVHPDDRATLQHNWELAADEKESSMADYRFIKPDGSIAYVIGQAVPEYNIDGQVIGYIGTITDITERKKVDEALQNSRESERAALEIKEIIQAANLSLSHTLNPGDVMKTLLDFLALIVPHDRARIILMRDDKSLEVCISRGFPPSTDEFINNSILKDIGNNQLLETVLIDHRTIVIKDTQKYAEWEKSAGPDHGRSYMGIPLVAGGETLGMFSLDKDEPDYFTTEFQGRAESLAAQAAVAIQNARLHERLRKHAEELEKRVAERTYELASRVTEVEALNQSMVRLNDDLKAAVKKAESADRLKSAFLATMSHELRTPLNSIIGFTGILLQKMVGPLSEEQEKQLRMVQGSARHLLELINDVLDISKIEADQILLIMEKFDINDSIQKSVDKIRPMAEKKGLQMLVDVTPQKMPLTSDRRRVEQILINLVNNAVKFTETGYVKITGQVGGDFYTVSVIDTGIGIKEEDIENLFKPFRQIDSGITRQYEGTGLGLSICKKLIDLLGGTITVSSEPGKGSIFAFTLPLSRE